jgi:hypothetical protein
MSKMYISIGKKWPHSRVPWWKRGSRGGKPRLVAYYVDENGKFGREQITMLQSLFIKSQIHKRKKFVCLSCGRSSFYLLPKKFKNIDSLPCEFCDS